VGLLFNETQQNASKLLANWQQNRSDSHCKTTAICVRSVFGSGFVDKACRHVILADWQQKSNRLCYFVLI